MTTRTIEQARAYLEEWNLNLPPDTRKLIAAEIADAERTMTGRATAAVERMADTHGSQARAVSEKLAQTRDDARGLTELIAQGRITTTDAAAQLERLRSNVRTLRTDGERLAEKVTEMDAIEADPIAYAEALADKFNHLRHDFSF